MRQWQPPGEKCGNTVFFNSIASLKIHDSRWGKKPRKRNHPNISSEPGAAQVAQKMLMGETKIAYTVDRPRPSLSAAHFPLAVSSNVFAASCGQTLWTDPCPIGMSFFRFLFFQITSNPRRWFFFDRGHSRTSLPRSNGSLIQQLANSLNIFCSIISTNKRRIIWNYSESEYWKGFVFPPPSRCVRAS